MAGITTGPMVGKTDLVTGGTRGIGKATAIGLAAAGTRVGIIGREIARTRAAAADLAAEAPAAAFSLCLLFNLRGCDLGVLRILS